MPKEQKGIPKEISKDISKKTIAILLIIAIILSITSMLVAVARQPEVVEVTEDSATAEIRVNVVEPPKPVEAEIKVNVVETK